LLHDTRWIATEKQFRWFRQKLDQPSAWHVVKVVEIPPIPLLPAIGRSGSWPEIIADLDSLTETEIEQDGKCFTVRSAPRPAASLAIRAAGVALPPTVRDASA
jgi:hypothetical protein